jgi:predicted nucleic acid-binding protein
VVLIDTSLWIEILRDPTVADAVRAAIDEDDVVLSRFVQLELLQGARSEAEWALLSAHLDTQLYLEMGPTDWSEAARLYFDARRAGRTIRSPIDCCIAQLAITHDALLLHRDRDFDSLAALAPLRHRFWTG